MFGQRKQAREALERLAPIVDEPGGDIESKKQRSLAAVSVIKPGSQLRLHCDHLVEAGDGERAVKLLQAATQSGGSVPVIGIMLVSLLPIALVFFFVAEPFGSGQATITSQTDACAAELFAGLEAARSHGGMGFTTTQADAQELMSTGTIAKTYGRDGARYTMTFRVRARDENCQLQAYRLTTRSPGSSETRRGNFGSVDLNVCKCE